MGEIVLTTPDDRTVTDPTFVKEAGGFTFFGDSCLEAIMRSPYTVRTGRARPPLRELSVLQV